MKKRYYKVTGYCSDCTGIDYKGCNDGLPFDLGNFTTEDHAFEKGNEFINTFPYTFTVEVIEIIYYNYDGIKFEK